MTSNNNINQRFENRNFYKLLRNTKRFTKFYQTIKIYSRNNGSICLKFKYYQLPQQHTYKNNTQNKHQPNKYKYTKLKKRPERVVYNDYNVSKDRGSDLFSHYNYHKNATRVKRNQPHKSFFFKHVCLLQLFSYKALVSRLFVCTSSIVRTLLFSVWLKTLLLSYSVSSIC